MAQPNSQQAQAVATTRAFAASMLNMRTVAFSLLVDRALSA
ncbi:hypothetical protein [Paraburkholderia terricola]|uniref:Uncharacterized protein n=1 Tax=Paraburkholderia terricola TaxID=169427 RepID=A0ABU1LLX0_9BURK|nr:hypothetical protein [Paraburkholderia terricola]MDR6407739.1 hypothetical protein [Paraburkholderia terricola]MDR6480045.1 hypothetical protein [Paraburkholderia terricola]